MVLENLPVSVFGSIALTMGQTPAGTGQGHAIRLVMVISVLVGKPFRLIDLVTNFNMAPSQRAMDITAIAFFIVATTLLAVIQNIFFWAQERTTLMTW